MHDAVSLRPVPRATQGDSSGPGKVTLLARKATDWRRKVTHLAGKATLLAPSAQERVTSVNPCHLGGGEGPFGKGRKRKSVAQTGPLPPSFVWCQLITALA
jgi:hypothetical protein